MAQLVINQKNGIVHIIAEKHTLATIKFMSFYKKDGMVMIKNEHDEVVAGFTRAYFDEVEVIV